jgi:hypothetical protein
MECCEVRTIREWAGRFKGEILSSDGDYHPQFYASLLNSPALLRNGYWSLSLERKMAGCTSQVATPHAGYLERAFSW